jgi:hypothetical protein
MAWSLEGIMKIESLQLDLASSHALQQHESVQTTIRRAASPQQPSPPPQSASSRPASPPAAVATTGGASSVVSLSSSAVALSLTSAEASAVQEAGSEDGLKGDKRYLLVKSLVESLGLTFDESTLDLKSAAAAPPASAAPTGDSVTRTVTRTTTRSEAEQSTFAAQGHATTRDGRQIDFNIQLNLARSQTEQSSASISFGPKVKDPLILNLEGSSAQLTQGKFSFDLNADGQAENISFATGGSAFLALDKNADGRINDGSELFGPSSNNGFAELAQYDQDHNQVIDENDPVFAQLRLYSKTADGQDNLATLAQKGVGAILLDHADTPFQIKDGQNQLQANLRSTGVYLRENGGAGTVQQVDLRV